ncbi:MULTISPECIES: hypothetical protein [unclassified Delftia]|uniref:hypothetical protein n=1 Tax=unclassified Delftia TaxID=2613839 RepID=UPI00190225C3|nr:MULTISPECIES: hypothetical protein [unclassified Delftia]MBK0114034.1 hypothetical protein [Delftia sp. S65]MBK0117842.1 hypothetical protein [Delftia sp. S67]MBK0129159.1 hypothetical protein [Delftia sp. S66]
MSCINKPKRALLAYCALADRIQGANTGMFGALAPFFAPVCREFAGQMFDAQAFSNEVAKLYGLRIPRLAVLGLAEQLEAQGLLVSAVGKASGGTVFQYASNVTTEELEAPGVSEQEIDSVLQQFVDSCRDDPLLANETEQRLQEEFLDRLLNAESMRLLARRETAIGAKAMTKTLTLKRAESTPQEQRELHLDFHVAQFLLDLRDGQTALFDRVSDIAFASMAAEALACFSEPAADQKSLNDLEVYLDSPLLLDMLGVNVEYAAYGAELLDMVTSSGAHPVVFDDCIVEAESVVSGRLASLRSGNARTSAFASSAKPHVLSALKDNVGSRAASVGIPVKKDPQLDIVRRSRNTVGDIEADLNRRMSNWPNEDARDHDKRSVWSMIRIRDANTLCERICDSKAIFITRNTALAHMANGAWKTWLTNAARQSDSNAARWAPIALSDKQLAGYLWLRSGEGNGHMSRARLLAHCSAAIRPRKDVRSRAINLVLELHGSTDADHVAALLENREGERALMRATRADPEDVTAERLPYIIEQVRLAAGEFAAAKAREEGDQRLAAQKAESDKSFVELKLQHEERLESVAAQHAQAREASEQDVKALKADLAQRHQDVLLLDSQIDKLSQQVQARERNDVEQDRDALRAAFKQGIGVFRRLRYLLVVLFASLVTFGTDAVADWPQMGNVLTFMVAAFGFWFVPNFLERPVRWAAIREVHRRIRRDHPRLPIPATEPDFEAGTWDALEALQLKLDGFAPAAPARTLEPLPFVQ